MARGRSFQPAGGRVSPAASGRETAGRSGAGTIAGPLGGGGDHPGRQRAGRPEAGPPGHPGAGAVAAVHPRARDPFVLARPVGRGPPDGLWLGIDGDLGGDLDWCGHATRLLTAGRAPAGPVPALVRGRPGGYPTRTPVTANRSTAATWPPVCTAMVITWPDAAWNATLNDHGLACPPAGRQQ